MKLEFGPAGELAQRQHEDRERSRRKKEMQKSLESGIAKRSICRRRPEQGREARGSSREDGGSMGARPVKDSGGGPRLCTAPCDFPGWSAEISCCSLTFFLCLQLLCSPCSGGSKHQGGRGQAGTSCIIFQHLKDQHY